METINIEIYKVGGYLFEDKDLALRLDKLLTENPNKIICPECKGTCEVEHIDVCYDYWNDINVFDKSFNRCKNCNDGTLTKVVETKFIK